MNLLIQLTLLLKLIKIAATFSCPPSVKSVCSCTTSFEGEFHNKKKNTVDCSSRELYEVPVLDFTERSKISRLTLRNNTLITISPIVFARKVHIENIDISNNPLGNTMSTGLFANVLKLKSVDASEIGLNLNLKHSLSFLQGLSLLVELDLSRNHEYAVPTLPDLFYETRLYGLQKLRIALCRIEDVGEDAFDGLNDLRELDLSQNFLSSVPKAVNQLSQLRKLSLRENDITIIHRGAFRGIHGLQELDISINFLGQMEALVPGSFFGVEHSLRTLALQDGQLTVIPTSAFSDLRQLTRLDLSYNRISVMNNRSFHGSYHLETLDMSGNPWITNNDMFSSVKHSLISLSMRDIGIKFLPRTPLSKLKHLRVLDASYNELKSISNGSFAGLSARTLLFKGNKISYISPYAFSGFPRAIYLDVSNNRIKSLDFVFKSDKCTFYRLNISDNSLGCDCQIEKLVNSLRVKRLSGNCASTDDMVYRLSNTKLTDNLERRCVRTEATHCFWWLPKSSHAPSIRERNAYIFVSIFMLFLFSAT